MRVFNKATNTYVELDSCDLQAESEGDSIKHSFPYRVGKAHTNKLRTRGSANTLPRLRQQKGLDWYDIQTRMFNLDEGQSVQSTSCD